MDKKKFDELLELSNELLLTTQNLPIEIFNDFSSIYSEIRTVIIQMNNQMHVHVGQINIIYHNKEKLVLKDLSPYFDRFISETKIIKNLLYKIQSDLKILLVKIKRYDVSKVVIEEFEKNSNKLVNEIINADKKYLEQIKELLIILKETMVKKDDTLVTKFQIFIDKFYSINEKLIDEIDKMTLLLHDIIFMFTCLNTFLILGNRELFISQIEECIIKLNFYQ